MKKVLLLLIALVASTTAPATDRVPDASLGAVVYDVCYKLAGITTKVATATITFVESEREGQPVYHSTARIETQPFFRLFLKAQYKAEAWYSVEDLAPLYFNYPFTDGKNAGKYEVTYDYDTHFARSVWAVEGSEPLEREHPLQKDKPSMELLSALNYIRFHDFKEGTPETVTLLMPSKAREATVTQEGERITFRINGNGVMENGSGNDLVFWRSSSPDRSILRLESDLGTGSLIVRLQK